MKLYHPDLSPKDTPITTIAEYKTAQQAYWTAIKTWLASLKKPHSERGSAGADKVRLRKDFRTRRLPYVLIAKCPFCGQAIWQKAMVFSLQDEFWYLPYSNGKDVYEESRCPHLFCVDGALNLNGHQPKEAQGSPISPIHGNYRITMAAEVPFVKPRVLNLPGMVAVIHRLSVAQRYTAYPIVYFAKKQVIGLNTFCIPWARTKYVSHGSYSVFRGRRSDVQAYDLSPWLEQKQIFWLDPSDGETLRHPTTANFPYAAETGRQHPYYIEDGQVFNLPDPVETPPETGAENLR